MNRPVISAEVSKVWWSVIFDIEEKHFFSVRLLCPFLPEITHLIKWGFGCLYILFDLLLLPLRKVSCILNKKTKSSKKWIVSRVLELLRRKNQEYTIRNRDFLTSRNVAMYAADRSPSDVTLTQILYSLENYTMK